METKSFLKHGRWTSTISRLDRKNVCAYTEIQRFFINFKHVYVDIYKKCPFTSQF